MIALGPRFHSQLPNQTGIASCQRSAFSNQQTSTVLLVVGDNVIMMPEWD